MLDTPYFIKLSADSIKNGGTGVSEADELSGGATGLGTGYGQSKWASEYLVRVAGAVVRPGYIISNKVSGD